MANLKKLIPKEVDGDKKELTKRRRN